MKTKVHLSPNMSDTWCWNNPPEVNICSKCGAPAELGGETWWEWWQHYITCSNLNCSKHFEKIESGSSSIEDIIKLWNERNPEMSFDNMIKHLELDGFKIIKQPNNDVYQIENVHNLKAITLSQSPTDIHIGIWQDNDNVQFALKSTTATYNFIKNLTW